MLEQLFKDKTLKFQGSMLRYGRKQTQYTADPKGIKRAIKDNLPDLEIKYNGKHEEIIRWAIAPDDTIITEIAKIKEANKKSVIQPGVLEYISTLKKLVFNKNPKDKRVKIYDPARDIVVDHYNEEQIHKIFLRNYGKDEGESRYAAWGASNEVLCTENFHQNSPRLVPTEPHLNFYDFNLYRIPEYRREEYPDPTEAEKKLLWDFMVHLFPNKEHREYFYAWAYISLTGRNETFLCLVGKHGVGKTMIMDFLSNLHGVDNSVRPKDPNAQFNYYLSAKSLVSYDEVKIDDTGKETFKRIANRLIQVERKGYDQQDVTNSASVILATNYHYMLNMDPDDRRFSVPDLGETRLEKAFPGLAGKIHSMVHDNRILRWFYEVLINRFEGDERLVGPIGKYGSNIELKNTLTFERCCRATARPEIAFALDLFRRKNAEGGAHTAEITFDSLKIKFKNEAQRRGGSGRIGKTSYFFSQEFYLDKLKKYTVDGKPVIKVENDIIFNNLHNDE